MPKNPYKVEQEKVRPFTVMLAEADREKLRRLGIHLSSFTRDAIAELPDPELTDKESALQIAESRIHKLQRQLKDLQNGLAKHREELRSLKQSLEKQEKENG